MEYLAIEIYKLNVKEFNKKKSLRLFITYSCEY